MSFGKVVQVNIIWICKIVFWHHKWKECKILDRKVYLHFIFSKKPNLKINFWIFWGYVIFFRFLTFSKTLPCGYSNESSRLPFFRNVIFTLYKSYLQKYMSLYWYNFNCCIQNSLLIVLQKRKLIVSSCRTPRRSDCFNEIKLTGVL